MGFGTSPIELLAADAMLRGEIFCQSFTYSARWLTGTSSALGANATVDQLIQITSEADFVVQEFGFTAFSATGTLMLPDFTMNIAVSSGRPWFDAAQTLLDLFVQAGNGTTGANLPMRTTLSMPRLIPAQTTIDVTLVNRTGTAVNRASLGMHGFNVYYQTANRQQVFHAL